MRYRFEILFLTFEFYFVELTDLTITQAHQGLIKKQFSALELAKAFLDRIKKRNKKISAFLTVCEDLALFQAKKIDDLVFQKRKIPLLAGIPCAIKDNILVKDIRCTAGSKILENYTAAYDATVIKLLKNQGVIVLGKANLDEFAIGSSGEYSAFGKTLNPHDLNRVSGGSSSGPAAAVADNLCVFALGSDTGGSIRLPASFCGVVGFKPTYGAVSRFGLMAMASSLDQIGPLARTVENAKIVFEAISKKDPMDSTSLGTDKRFQVSPGRLLEQPARQASFKFQDLVIGIPREYFVRGIEPEIEAKILEAIKKFEKMGARIKEIGLSHTKYALATYYIIMTAEVSANLARYDGIRFGFSKANSKIKNFTPTPKFGAGTKIKNLLDVYLQSRGKGFGEEVRRRIMLGTYVLSRGFYEAYYLKAQKVRTLIREDFNKAFQKVDIILTPTSPTLPFRIGEKMKNPLSMYLSDIFMIAVNLAGLPAISIPCGKVKNLPVGLQIIGKEFQDYKILEVAQALEKTCRI